MSAALPLSKLAGLLIKTLAKPVAKRIKHEFSRSQITQGALISVGEATHQITSRLTIWSAGYKVRSVKPLEHEEALKKGAEFLGESLVFFVGGAVVVWEYNNTKEKERQKEQKRHEEMQRESDELQQKFNILDVRLRALEKVVKQNSESILNIGRAKYEEPAEAKDPTINKPLYIPKPPSVGKKEPNPKINFREEEIKRRQQDEEEWAEKMAKRQKLLAKPTQKEPEKSQSWWGWLTYPFRGSGINGETSARESSGGNNQQ